MTKLVIGKDRISVTQAEVYVSGTSDAYKCTVTFSKDWEGLQRKIVFRAVIGSSICDEVYTSIEAIAMSMKFAIPNKVFVHPSQKVQVSAIGSRKGREESDGVILRTPWTTIGRVIEGATIPCEPSPDDPDNPSPPSSNTIPPGGTKDQVLAKASDDDYDFYWMSVSGLPIVSSAGIAAPIKSVMYYAGDLADIPEGWALCDGQNGTPDLRGKVIISATSDGTSPSEGLAEGTAVPVSATLYPIMNLSAEPTAGAPGKSAYEIDVENGFEGTEEEWLASLRGKSAYELAVQAGFTGTQEEFGKALKVVADIPSASTLTISSKSTMPEDGAGAYYFENVSLMTLARSSVQIKRDYVYLDDTDPTKLRVTTLSGAIYDCVYAEDGDSFVSINFVDKETSTLPTAAQVSYNDETSNLGAATVQSAIETLAARNSGGGGDTPSDFTPVTQFKPAAGTAGPFILSSAKPFLNISGATVRFTYASLQLPDGTNIHSFEDEFVYVRRLPSQVLEFYMSDGEALQITYKETTKDFISFKIEESIYENVFTLVKNKLITSTTELYAAFEQNTSKCYHLKNMSFQKIGGKAQFFKDDIVSVTWVTGSEVCYVNALDRTLRLTWDSSVGTAFTSVEFVETTASDVMFDDSAAKLGATNVQAAVDTLASSMPIIKDKAFRKTSDLAEYNAGMTYRMIDVQFLDSKGVNIVTFANDPVYVRSLQSPTGTGFTPALYTMDGYRFEIVADSQGDFTSSSVTDAFEGAAPDSLPFQIIENATITSLSQLMNLGITSDEMFFVRNVSFKLPDSSTNTIRITGNDWIQVSWNLSMSLKVYSTDANWHIEWDSSDDTKPFTNIEDWNNREGLITQVGVDASNVNELKALRSFFGYAMKLRSMTITTSAGGLQQRSYDNDVVYATNDTTSKIVTITRLSNLVDIFTYDDTGGFTGVTTRNVMTMTPVDITTADIASATELKSLCNGLDSSTAYFHGNAGVKVSSLSIQIKERLADVIFKDSEKTVKICFIDGSSYTLTYGDDGVFADWSFSQNGSEPAALDLDSYEVIETNPDSVIAVMPDGANVYRHYMDLTVEINSKELTIANFPNVELVSPITGIIEAAGATEWCSIPGSYEDFTYGLSYVKETGDIKLRSSVTSLSEKKVRLTIDYVEKEATSDAEKESEVT